MSKEKKKVNMIELHQRDSWFEYGLISCASKKGEDKFSWLAKDSYVGFGIFDGHGGPDASRYCEDNFLKDVLTTISLVGDFFESAEKLGIDMEDAHDAIVCASIRIAAEKSNAAIRMLSPNTGTCASMLFARKTEKGNVKIYCANIGSSRIVCLDKKGNAFAMTEDHDLDLHRELERIRQHKPAEFFPLPADPNALKVNNPSAPKSPYPSAERLSKARSFLESLGPNNATLDYPQARCRDGDDIAPPLSDSEASLSARESIDGRQHGAKATIDEDEVALALEKREKSSNVDVVADVLAAQPLRINTPLTSDPFDQARKKLSLIQPFKEPGHEHIMFEVCKKLGKMRQPREMDMIQTLCTEAFHVLRAERVVFFHVESNIGASPKGGGVDATCTVATDLEGTSGFDMESEALLAASPPLGGARAKHSRLNFRAVGFLSDDGSSDGSLNSVEENVSTETVCSNKFRNPRHPIKTMGSVAIVDPVGGEVYGVLQIFSRASVGEFVTLGLVEMSIVSDAIGYGLACLRKEVVDKGIQIIHQESFIKQRESKSGTSTGPFALVSRYNYSIRTTRGLGNAYGPRLCSCIPEITMLEISPGRRVRFVFGTKSVWDEVSIPQCVALLERPGARDANQAAGYLMRKAVSSRVQTSASKPCDTTCMVVDIFPEPVAKLVGKYNIHDLPGEERVPIRASPRPGSDHQPVLAECGCTVA